MPRSEALESPPLLPLFTPGQVILGMRRSKKDLETLEYGTSYLDPCYSVENVRASTEQSYQESVLL